jgi:hypothetical protein
MRGASWRCRTSRSGCIKPLEAKASGISAAQETLQLCIPAMGNSVMSTHGG